MSKQKRKSKKADGSSSESTAAPPVVGDGVAKTSDVEASATAPSVDGPKSKRARKKKSERLASAEGEAAESAQEGREGKSNSDLKVAPAVLDKKLDALEQKLEEKIDAHQAARKGMATDPDDSSIPPVVEHEHEEQFFADAEKKPPVTSGMSGGFDMIDPKHAQKMTAAAQARRAHLTRYVKGAVAVGLVICAVAFIRMKLAPPDRDSAHTTASQSTTQVIIPEVKTPDPVKQPDPTAVQVVESAPITGDIQDMTGADAKAIESDGKDGASSSPVGVMADNTVKPKNAWQEKATAKAALESGNNGTAIAAGERSVALDASDGETWLVLGAAYQASGNVTQAKRCFNACISQGKKGPIDECKSMLASM